MKKILYFAAAMVAFVSCNEAVTTPDREYFFDEEVSRFYNDPNAEMDTLSYAAGMNAGLVISIKNADFDVDTDAVITLLDKELKNLVTDEKEFEEVNTFLSDFSVERVRPFMIAKHENSKVVTECPDTLSLPVLFDETYSRDDFHSALALVFADGMRKQRLPVNLHWVYEAMRDSKGVGSKEDIDSVMAFSEKEFINIMTSYMQTDMAAYNKELANKWFERVSVQEGVEQLLAPNGKETGVYYRINRAGGDVKPFNDTDSISVKYEVYSRTGQLIESNEKFIESLEKQREVINNNKMMPDSLRNVYLNQIDDEIAKCNPRQLPLNRFMSKDVQEALKHIGDGGEVTVWLDANRAMGFRATQVLPINEAVVVNVELVSVKTIKPTPKPVNNVITMPAGNIKAKMAPNPNVAPKKPTIVPVQK